MVQSTKKLFFLGLLACAGVLFAHPGTTVAAEGSETPKILQPQGLNHGGIYALRQLNPSLTGMGVRYGVVSRSVTYIGGEPQNDYRPSVGHSCFEGRQFGFHDDGRLPGGVSAHSTAICSILWGEDPDAFDPALGRFYYQGVAPAATANVYEFWHFLTDYVFGHSPPDVDILTASVGNQFEDWWTRGIDSLVEHYGLIVVAGIGNGSETQDPTLFPGASALLTRSTQRIWRPAWHSLHWLIQSIQAAGQQQTAGVNLILSHRDIVWLLRQMTPKAINQRGTGPASRRR
ncbi:MAG: hypothetical protein ACYSTF_08200 [Planctomycetota bacterium]|jgi:hypothetical protein